MEESHGYGYKADGFAVPIDSSKNPRAYCLTNKIGQSVPVAYAWTKSKISTEGSYHVARWPEAQALIWRICAPSHPLSL
jgi:hypothetical protein